MPHACYEGGLASLPEMLAMSHPALGAGGVAVVTGAAMGIGLAACKRFAAAGLKVCLADIEDDDLEQAQAEVAAVAPGGEADVLAVVCNVARPDDLSALNDRVRAELGEITLLMNNAVTRVGGGPWAPSADWHQAVDVNLWGVINGVRAFAPEMIASGKPGIVINVGSKQGITNPPGNLAYNMSKAAVKAYTEGLQHELRNTPGCKLSAHLLIPGWTTTGKREHKTGAWLPEQVVDLMIPALERGDFYILCPDDEVTEEMDRTRILWGAGDIAENRPPLSRWHPDHAEAFEAFSRNRQN